MSSRALSGKLITHGWKSYIHLSSSSLGRKQKPDFTFFRIKRFLAGMRTLVAFLRVYYIPESTFQATQFADNSYEKQTIKFSETRNSKLNRKTETMNQSSFFSLFARFQNFVQNRCSSGRFHLFTARSRVERETARS